MASLLLCLQHQSAPLQSQSQREHLVLLNSLLLLLLLGAHLAEVRRLVGAEDMVHLGVRQRILVVCHADLDLEGVLRRHGGPSAELMQQHSAKLARSAKVSPSRSDDLAPLHCVTGVVQPRQGVMALAARHWPDRRLTLSCTRTAELRPWLKVASVGNVDIHIGIKLDQGPVWIEVVGSIVVSGRVARRAPKDWILCLGKLVGGKILVRAATKLVSDVVKLRNGSADDVDHVVVVIAGKKRRKTLKPIRDVEAERVLEEADEGIGFRRNDGNVPESAGGDAARREAGSRHLHLWKELEAMPGDGYFQQFGHTWPDVVFQLGLELNRSKVFAELGEVGAGASAESR